MSTTRSSARIKAATEAAHARALPQSEVLRPSHVTVPARKKSRKMLAKEAVINKPSAPKVKGRRGKLRLVTEMPLDILLETFRHLQPQDLLNLSIASKSLRAILLSRFTSAGIWKSAFHKADPAPPECPPDINLVQYANFLYGRFCKGCAAPNASWVSWTDRSRYCSVCISSKQFVLFQPSKATPAQMTAWRIVPRWMAANHRQNYLQKKEFEATCNEVDQLTKHDSALGTKLCEAFIANEKAAYEQKAQSIHLFNHWVFRLKNDRSIKLRQARERRKNAILAKLREMGWGEELDLLGSYVIGRNLPWIHVSKDLTDRTWENIKPDIIAYLELQKKTRLRRERRNILHGRYRHMNSMISLWRSKQLVDSATLPTQADFANMEPFRTLLFDTPLDRDVSLNEIKDLEDILPELASVWKKSCDKTLIRLLSDKSVVQGQDPKLQLGLATTIFSCASCEDIITYPRILAHSCLRDLRNVRKAIKPEEQSDEKGKDEEEEGDDDEGSEDNKEEGQQEDEDEDEEDEDEDILLEILGSWNPIPWNYQGDQVTLNDVASNSAKAVIIACGEDPNTATPAQMDEIDARIECVRCVHPSRGRLVMTWRMALIHELEEHEEDAVPTSWKKVTEVSDLEKTHTKEASHIKRFRSLVYDCILCGSHCTRNSFENHVRWCREKDKLDKDPEKNFRITADAPMKRPPYAVRI
ncbi:hypothetical protein BDQ12DRAFT_676019 [Crucibulum laeve]|uniref:F-box domain-containing protein n=1 Tax=Crucibulum laeve TaxID=68775 RepID=A0A5C3MD51_9AGAR|nr:hypothetical protein BDQ12DRAFT_676019 [Crucibulum laeve]